MSRAELKEQADELSGILVRGLVIQCGWVRDDSDFNHKMILCTEDTSVIYSTVPPSISRQLERGDFIQLKWRQVVLTRIPLIFEGKYPHHGKILRRDGETIPFTPGRPTLSLVERAG